MISIHRIHGAHGITHCDCDPPVDLQKLADVIRREVRLSAGIEEGQEFQCDWTRVAESALATVRGAAARPSVSP